MTHTSCAALPTPSGFGLRLHPTRSVADPPPQDRDATFPSRSSDTALTWHELPSRSLANCIADRHKKSVTTQPQSPVQIPDLEQRRKAQRPRKDREQFVRSDPL